MLTKQEIFDRVWTTLAARNWQPAKLDDRMCLYKSPVGPCAAGIFIPDDLYRPDMEGKLLMTSRGFCISEAQQLLYDAVASVVGREQVAFVRELQIVHDDWYAHEFKSMEDAFRAVATEYNLTIPTEALV